MNADDADKPAFRGSMVEKSVPQVIQQEDGARYRRK
jgi:hypothetical protein